VDRMLYVAMSGAKQVLAAQAANNHNLANASTPGFRADLSAFRAMPVFDQGFPSRVYAMAERPGVQLAAGTLTQTGRELDVAIRGEGWIAVRAPDGSEAYTRDGALQVDSTGRLTSAGHPVLGNGGPIALPPAEKLEVGTDGTIAVRAVGEGPETVAPADRIKLVNPPPKDLIKGEDGLMHLRSGAAALPDASVTLVSGALESSNVSAVDALVRMVELSRQFDLQVKAMHAAEDSDAASTRMMRLE
jgi:flagellar basal-body rod protein FlgF